MSWGDAVGSHMAQIREDHARAQMRAEDAAWAAASLHYGVSFKQGHRAGFWDGATYVINQQLNIDDLTVGQMLAELRKKEGSIWWPVKAADPRFWAYCPACDNWTLLGEEGICDHCTYEFGNEQA